MDKEMRVTKYISCVYQYGIIPMLKLLEEYEKVEKYEECHLITLAIDTLNTYDKTTEKLPKSYRADVYALKMNFSKFGCQGDISASNISYYVDRIKKEVV